MKIKEQVDVVRMDAWPIVYEELEHGTPAATDKGVLSVVIPYTTPELTQAALQHAAVCSDLNVQVSLVDVQVVPFPCPLDQPPINKAYSRQRLQDAVKESSLPVRAAVLYSRDRLEGFRQVLDPKSLIIVPTKKRWWPTREVKLARALSAMGHQVMLFPVVR